jgi:hypothetical protein
MFWTKWFAPKKPYKGIGAGAMARKAQSRQAIVAVLRERGAVMTTAEVADCIGECELYTEARLQELWLWGRSIWKCDPIRWRIA